MNAQKISTTLSFLIDVAHASLQISDASAGIIVQLIHRLQHDAPYVPIHLELNTTSGCRPRNTHQQTFPPVKLNQFAIYATVCPDAQ